MWLSFQVGSPFDSPGLNKEDRTAYTLIFLKNQSKGGTKK